MASKSERRAERRAKKIPEAARGSISDLKNVPQAAKNTLHDDSGQFVQFRFDLVDLDSAWSILDIEKEDHRTLITRMSEFEKLTVKEILSPTNKHFKIYSDVTQCPKPDLQNRLSEKFDGWDSVARFQITAKGRLYGFLTGHEFHITWWDRDHLIWPSEKKNT